MRIYPEAFFEAIVDETDKDGGLAGRLFAQENHFDLALHLCEGRFRLFLVHLNQFISYFRAINISMADKYFKMKIYGPPARLPIDKEAMALN